MKKKIMVFLTLSLLLAGAVCAEQEGMIKKEVIKKEVVDQEGVKEEVIEQEEGSKDKAVDKGQQ